MHFEGFVAIVIREHNEKVDETLRLSEYHPEK